MDSSLHPDVDLHDPCQHDRQVNRPLTLDADLLAQLLGEPSRLRITLSGYPEIVNREILNLHHCGYDIDAWSSPQRIPGTADVITGYTKRNHWTAS